MFSVCMILGVVPIIPKRKEESIDEATIQESDTEGNTGETVLFNTDFE